MSFIVKFLVVESRSIEVSRIAALPLEVPTVPVPKPVAADHHRHFGAER